MTCWCAGRQRAYHHTAPVNNLYGLHVALLILNEKGLEKFLGPSCPGWSADEYGRRCTEEWRRSRCR